MTQCSKKNGCLWVIGNPFRFMDGTSSGFDTGCRYKFLLIKLWCGGKEM